MTNIDAFIYKSNIKHNYKYDYSKFQYCRAIDKINIVNKKTFGDLYNFTIEREKFLNENGYKIISIWESDFTSL